MMLNRTCDELVMNFQRKPSDCPTGAVLSGNFVETKSNVLSLTLEGHTVTRSQLGMFTRSESRMVN